MAEDGSAKTNSIQSYSYFHMLIRGFYNSGMKMPKFISSGPTAIPKCKLEEFEEFYFQS